MVSDEELGCDCCAEPIDFVDDTAYISATLCYQEDNTATLHFCSWTCALTKLSTVGTDYFIDLPTLHYDAKRDSPRSPAAFWQAVREFGNP